MGVEILRTISVIYTFVLSAQAAYCNMDMRHPFLEQTYMNVAIFNRSMKKYADSLIMFKRLETLQRAMYGEENPLLLFVLKNIGNCYLGLGDSESARKCFQQSIDLLKVLKVDEDKKDIKLKDEMEMSNLQFNLSMTYITDRDF